MRPDLWRYVFKRLLTVIPVGFIATIAIFLLVRVGPGNPVVIMLGKGASDETIREMERKFGLDQPLPVQYFDWITSVLQGDFGESIVISSGADVLPMLIGRLQVTLTLGLFALVFAIIIALVAGTIAATYHGRFPDYFATSVSVLGVSMPNYWLGYMLIIVLSVNLNLLPSFEYVSPWAHPIEGFRHILLPALTIGLPISAVLSRMLRSEMLEKRDEEYLEVAHAFGIDRRRIFTQYWLRNSLIPVVTVLGVQIRYLLGGAVIIEEVFGIAGSGRLLASAIFAYDFQVIQSTVLVFVVFVIASNLLVDVAYAILDPRVKY